MNSVGDGLDYDGAMNIVGDGLGQLVGGLDYGGAMYIVGDGLVQIACAVIDDLLKT